MKAMKNKRIKSGRQGQKEGRTSPMRVGVIKDSYIIIDHFFLLSLVARACMSVTTV